jgi:hypothetical protein
MYCPICGAEYREGFNQCADCEVPLVDEPVEPRTGPVPPPDPESLKLATAFTSADPALIVLAKSLLESAGIPYLVRGEGVQDLIGFGRFPGGANLLTGPVEVQVNAEDLDGVKTLLQDLLETD